METTDGHKYVVTGTCYFTKLVETAKSNSKYGTGLPDFLHSCLCWRGMTEIKSLTKK